ncbi:AmmeMemoRadiSam system protein B [Vibrio natriegens]|uniref:AmmeMemoRadiSam system protein B n=1 Tax=Vibrio natriegens TaxID=691 RepID=UPI001FB935BA|nr:AmmeMemoRadiSam system protein B [Vibrio natriegens]
MKYREAAVAGRFYPATANELITQLDGYFAEQALLTEAPKALIVPHAGYFYSGEVAAKAFRLLSNSNNTFSRVVLFGPSHHVALDGCAVPDSDVFLTPTGEVMIDREGVEDLLSQDLVATSDQAHHWEHSLEVQLPFLQYCLNDFTLLPIVVGRDLHGYVKRILEAVTQTPNTLIVVSSDLSHYHPYSEANEIDADTIQRVLSFGSNIHPERACGCNAINGLLDFAKEQHWEIKCINYTNSGDVMAHHENRAPEPSEGVVGYASFILF